MNLLDLLEKHACDRPDQTALVDRIGGVDRTLTFRELHNAVAQQATAIVSAGLKPGDSVLMLHPVRIELYVALLAIFRQGLTAVFVDPGQGREFVGTVCKMVLPSAFFGSPKAHLLRLLIPAIRKISRHFHTSGWVPFSHCLDVFHSSSISPNPPPPAATTADTPALITFTSGSTGQPKGIVRSHGFLLAQHRILAQSLRLTAGEVDLATLPVFVLANLASGLTSVLADCDIARVGAADGHRIARQMKEWKVQRLAASPAFLRQLLRCNTQIPTLRTIHTGGAPVFPNLLEKLTARFPQASVEAIYGSSEAEPMAHLDARDIAATDRLAMQQGKGLLAGTCDPAAHVAVISATWGTPIPRQTEESFSAMKVPPEAIGEIVVAGEHVVQGYFQGRGDTETKFAVGKTIWHRTGDSGWFDTQGRLWLTGRCAAVLSGTSTHPLHPFCVETAVSFLDDVQGCAVVEHRGQRLLAVETDAISDTLRELAAQFGIQVIVPMKIPWDKRHNAKVDYAVLHQRLTKHDSLP